MVIYENDNAVLTDLTYLDNVSAMDFFTEYKLDSFDYLDISSEDICVDIGCGTGEDIFSLANYIGEKGFVIGIDVNEEAIRLAQSKSQDPRIKFRHEHAEKINLEDNSVDKVRADRVFQHLKDPKRVLKEMVRITKPGGKVQVVDTEWDSLCIDTNEIDILNKFKFGMLQKYENPFSGRKLYRMLKDIGLGNIRVEIKTLVLNSYEEINMVFDLENYLDYVVDNGYLTLGEAKLLQADLKALDQKNTVFAFICGAIVTGTKLS